MFGKISSDSSFLCLRGNKYLHLHFNPRARKTYVDLVLAPAAVEKDLLRFQAGGRTIKPGFGFVFILCCSIFVFRMNVRFCCVRFSFFGTSQDQEIGWEERLRNDLFCVEWDVKL